MIDSLSLANLAIKLQHQKPTKAGLLKTNNMSTASSTEAISIVQEQMSNSYAAVALATCSFSILRASESQEAA